METIKQIETDTDRDCMAHRILCAFLNHKLSYTLTCLLKLYQLSKYSVLATEQVLHCVPTLNLTQNTKVPQPQITESFMCWILQPGPFRRPLFIYKVM